MVEKTAAVCRMSVKIPNTLHLKPHQEDQPFASEQPQTTTLSNSSTSGGLPQTPAQQVLMSAADRWGLLGLLAMIRSSDPETTLLSIGADLGTMGLDMQQQG